MAPFVGDDERALERQQAAGDQRFEKERIGHAVDAGAAEIPVEQRALRPRRHDVARDPGVAQRAREAGRQAGVDRTGRRPPAACAGSCSALRRATASRNAATRRRRGHRATRRTERVAQTRPAVVETPQREEQQIARPRPRRWCDTTMRERGAAAGSASAGDRVWPGPIHATGRRRPRAHRAARTAPGSTATSAAAAAAAYNARRVPAIDGRRRQRDQRGGRRAGDQQRTASTCGSRSVHCLPGTALNRVEFAIRTRLVNNLRPFEVRRSGRPRLKVRCRSACEIQSAMLG